MSLFLTIRRCHGLVTLFSKCFSHFGRPTCALSVSSEIRSFRMSCIWYTIPLQTAFPNSQTRVELRSVPINANKLGTTPYFRTRPVNPSPPRPERPSSVLCGKRRATRCVCVLSAFVFSIRSVRCGRPVGVRDFHPRWCRRSRQLAPLSPKTHTRYASLLKTPHTHTRTHAHARRFFFPHRCVKRRIYPIEGEGGSGRALWHVPRPRRKRIAPHAPVNTILPTLSRYPTRTQTARAFHRPSVGRSRLQVHSPLPAQSPLLPFTALGKML